jgi:hypothetical protein
MCNPIKTEIKTSYKKEKYDYFNKRIEKNEKG